MEKAIKVNDIGSALCRAYGLDPERVLSISFTWSAGEIAIVSVVMLAEGGMSQVMKKYMLMPMDEDSKQ